MDYREILLEVAEILGKSIDKNKIDVIFREKSEKIEKLPENKMAIYMFKYKDSYLKIGKVGPNSNARFTSQHYNPNSSNSNLAKSLINDKEFQIEIGYILDKDNVREWMKDNLDRIDILMDESLGIFTLDLFEMCLHYNFSPKYEGFKNQQYNSY